MVVRSLNDPLTSHNNNVNGFLNMLHASKENNIKRFVYASSSSVYGDDSSDIKIEDRIGKVLSPYSLTKYIDELYASLYTRIFDMECIGLRYFNVFGPRQNPNGPYAAVIPKFISSLSEGKRVTIKNIIDYMEKVVSEEEKREDYVRDTEDVDMIGEIIKKGQIYDNNF